MKKLFYLMNASYVVDKYEPVIVLFSRDAETRRVIHRVYGFKPYFYAPSRMSTLRDCYGRPITKVYAQLPSMVPQLRKQYPWTCEADIPFAWRYLIDRKVKYAYLAPAEKTDLLQHEIEPAEGGRVVPRILYFDIEVAAPQEIFPQPENPKWPIVTIQCLDTYTNVIKVFALQVHQAPEVQHLRGFNCKVHVETFPDDVTLLTAFSLYVEFIDPDILTGWNILGFDLPYLANRAAVIGADIRRLSPLRKVTPRHVSGRAVIDMLEAYRRWKQAAWGEMETYDLKYILKYETGLEYEDIGDRISEYWRNQEKHRELVEYCVRDVEALAAIDRKVGLLDFYDTLRQIAGAPLDAISNAKLIDYLCLRLRKKPLPTKTAYKKQKVRGAIVLTPEPGLHEWVGVFDMKSLYPSIIIKYRISPDVDRELMPNVVKHLLQLREKYRERRRELEGTHSYEYYLVKAKEVAAKFLVCSCFGVFAWEGARLYHPDCANEITRRGREILLGLKSYIAQQGFKVLYGDTDSIFVSLGKCNGIIDAISTGRYIEGLINQYIQEQYGEGLYCKFEKIFRRLFFKLKTKKRYVGLLVWCEGKQVHEIEIKGFEPRRSDTADYTREAMRSFFKELMEEGVEEALQLLLKMWKNFEKQPLWRIAIPKGVRMYTHEYRIDNPWLRGVRWAQRHFGWRFREDQKPLLLYVKNIAGTDVICLPNPDYEPKGVQVDMKRQREKAFEQKFKDILKSLGYSIDWLRSGGRQRKLTDYM